MKFLTSNISKAGFIAGLIFSIGSFVRYYILYPDLDKAIVYCIIGLGICFASWVYDRLQTHDNELDSIGEYLRENLE